jgi:hypothetical protein
VPTTAIAIDPFNTNHVYAGNDLGVYVSTDGGSNWRSFNEGLFEAVIVGDLTISPSNTSLRLASHSNGVFTRKLLSTSPTGVDEPHERPEQFVLHQNYPNPFNPTTRISYSLSGRAHILLEVYDVSGRRVATLVDRTEEQGLHIAELDGSDLATGAYLYCLRVQERIIQTRKALLIR